MTPNISYRPTRLPDAVPPNRNSCAGQPPETASGNYLQPSRFQHATPPPCLRRPYNKYRISLPTFQKIPEFYRFIKSIFYGTRLLPLPRQRTVRTATALKGRIFKMRPEGTPRLCQKQNLQTVYPRQVSGKSNPTRTVSPALSDAYASSACPAATGRGR